MESSHIVLNYGKMKQTRMDAELNRSLRRQTNSTGGNIKVSDKENPFKQKRMIKIEKVKKSEVKRANKFGAFGGDT